MEAFFTKNIENQRMELMVDNSIFPAEVIMRSAYAFLDRAYFFFRMTETGILLQIQPKEWQTWDAEKFALEYSDELLATYLRVRVEKENKMIRETIVKRALGSYADLPNFTSVNPAEQQAWQIDFDKDIDEILREIENDPELKIDEEEISRILAEIESDTQSMATEKKPKIDPNKLKDVKKNFSNK
jgi:His-Xaa-Ser system protein HxsD